MVRKYKIPKGNGKYRFIMEPIGEYKTFLKALNYELSKYIYKNNLFLDEQHGFILGRGVVTNAKMHIGYDYTMKIDIKNFFDSINLYMVKSAISEFNATSDFEYKKYINYCFYNKQLPQGFPTSPALSNLVSASIIRYIKAELYEKGLEDYVLTNYADDFNISWNGEYHKNKIIYDAVKDCIEGFGLELNKKKTKIKFGSSGYRIITGISVGSDHIRPTRKMKHNYKKALHLGLISKSTGIEEFMRLKEPKARNLSQKFDVDYAFNLYEIAKERKKRKDLNEAKRLSAGSV